MPTGSGNIIRVGVKWIFAGSDEQVNVWHVRVNFSSAITDEDLGEAIATWLPVQYGLVDQLMSTTVVHSDVELYNVTLDFPYTPLGAIPALSGDDSTDYLPSDIAACITWRTGVSRRLGKKYLPTFTKATMTSGLWTSATMTALNDFASLAELAYDFNGNIILTPGVWSAQSVAFSSYASHVVRNVPSGQDRRKRQIGS